MVPVQGAAVPAVVPELVLALPDPLLGSLPDRLHDVRISLAQLPLLVHQPWDVIADHPRAQRPDIPARENGATLARCPRRGKVRGSGSPGPHQLGGRACTEAHSFLSSCVTAALGSAKGVPPQRCPLLAASPWRGRAGDAAQHAAWLRSETCPVLLLRQAGRRDRALLSHHSFGLCV